MAQRKQAKDHDWCSLVVDKGGTKNVWKIARATAYQKWLNFG